MKTAETTSVIIRKYSSGIFQENNDTLAVEEPLEISLRIGKEGIDKNISITMRTPGKDSYLAAGFLFTEGIIKNADDIISIHEAGENQITVVLDDVNTAIDLSKLNRHFYTNSSCGVCGKTSIELLSTLQSVKKIESDFVFKKDALFQLNDQVRKTQSVFESTGGIHASALFDENGILISLSEDVGRHNALDKLIGEALLKKTLPMQNHVLFLSGRASFELVQKATMAQIPIICALGAPSSMAVELAKEFGITLIGFLKKESFNIYSGSERIV